MTSRIEQLEQLVRSFVLDEIDYMTINHLGDPEQKHNVKWARKLGITDTLAPRPAPPSIRRTRKTQDPRDDGTEIKF